MARCQTCFEANLEANTLLESLLPEGVCETQGHFDQR